MATKGLYRTMAASMWKVTSHMSGRREQTAMAHGRRVDRELKEFLEKRRKKTTLCADAKAVVALLSRKQWKLVACQYRVQNTTRHTFLDMLCTSLSGESVILELKSTLQRFSVYRQYYHRVDDKHPVMRDRTPNTKYWRHQKQLLGNMRLWRAQEGNARKVLGFVLVVCKGVASIIPLDPKLAGRVACA